jgi:hypothetical protein
MSGKTLAFGRHRGKTVFQVLLEDPDWFFWAIENGVFKGHFAEEAAVLARKARRIRIPKKCPELWRVEYLFDVDDSFRGFSLVKAKSQQVQKWSARGRYLDWSWPHCQRPGHKRGNKKLIDSFRRYYFGGRNITGKRWEAFFDNDDNFVKM